MSSSEDDLPLLRGRRPRSNVDAAQSSLSTTKVPHSVDQALDKEIPSGEGVAPAISIHKGPADALDLDSSKTNEATVNGIGSSKRKATQAAGAKKGKAADEYDTKPSKRQRTSTANSNKRREATSSSDSEDVPLVAKKSASKSGTAATPNGTKTPNPRRSNAQQKGAGRTPSTAELKREKKEIEQREEEEAKSIRKSEKNNKPGGPVKKGAPSKKKPKVEESDDDDDDEPIAATRRASKAKETPSTAKKATAVKKEIKAEASDDDDSKPLRRKAPTKQAAPKGQGKSAPATPGTSKGKAAAKKQETVDDDDEEADAGDEEFRWWEEEAKGDGSKKWNTLQHNGVIFPPPYEALPSSVKMRYDGVPVTLRPGAEEVAGFFGAMLNSTLNVENPTFQKNFFHDFTGILKSTGGAKDKNGKPVKVKDFAKCDFSPIFEYYESKKAEKKALSGADKKQLKAEKDALEAPFTYCVWDGRREKVGNFRVEPPGLFRGRGQHPKTGHVKKRVLPEDITINIGRESTVPTPPEGHRWKAVKHDQTGTWLAMWQENINGSHKYVMLAATSAIKGKSDYQKFEKARELKKHIDRVRADYKRDLKAELMADRQRATAVYLIDELALRAGNEKGEDEADTVGCCSLKYEHITLKPPRTVIFDFLGKDSIRFYNEVEVDEQVFKNLKIFKKAPKKDGDEVFDRLKTSQLNQHLSSYMPGLTAKVFRTYNASKTMADELRQMNPTGSVQDKIKDYNEANRRVAILCNHKRTIPASHEGQMEKLTEKIKGLKYQKWRTKQQMLNLEPALKKKKGADFFKLDEDLNEDWIVQHQAFLVQEQRQKIEKKFQKDNEKLVTEGEKEMKTKELDERLEVADDLEKQFRKENTSKKVEPEGRNPTVERMETSLQRLDERIATMNTQAEMRESTKEVALGTSKINYIDPRLTVVFSKKFNVPIERFFSKTLRGKFEWAIQSVDESWDF